MVRLRSPVGILTRALVVGAALVLGACATSEPTGPAGRRETALRVGVTSLYPPIIFKLKDQMAGVEADLAVRLGQALGRRVVFVELRWEDQIPALLAGTIDIIMSGMSITEARKVRIAFAEPYLESGLLTAMRTQDVGKYATRDAILNTSGSVGVIEGTTGDVFVQRNFPSARKIVFSRASDGALGLQRRTIDLFVHDAPSVVWLVSENEAELSGFWQLLNRESLAWGVRRGDTELLGRVNDLLRGWKTDGSLTALLRKWLPYWKYEG